MHHRKVWWYKPKHIFVSTIYRYQNTYFEIATVNIFLNVYFRLTLTYQHNIYFNNSSTTWKLQQAWRVSCVTLKLPQRISFTSASREPSPCRSNCGATERYSTSSISTTENLSNASTPDPTSVTKANTALACKAKYSNGIIELLHAVLIFEATSVRWLQGKYCFDEKKIRS